MALKRPLRRAALWAESVLDDLLSFKRTRRPPIIEPYTGYATPDALVARGRVLTALRRQAPAEDQGWLRNLRQMLMLFLTDEVEGVRVRAEAGPGLPAPPKPSLPDPRPAAVTDEEGYFTLVLPRGEGDLGGWTEVEARIETSGRRPRRHGIGEPARLPVLVPGPGARLGVISDIDDTVMETGAYSLARNLWTSLTGNALTRHVYPDAVDLLSRLSEEGRNPVFYVSSSPWNLHHFLESVFARAGLVTGPMFLRDLGLAETPPAPGSGPHGGHKLAAIDTLMAANPGLPFWLVGDTGQHDAEIYLAVARKYPGRVVRVALREPGPGPDAKSLRAMDALRAMGVAVTSDRDFWAAARLLPQGSGLGPGLGSEIDAALGPAPGAREGAAPDSTPDPAPDPAPDPDPTPARDLAAQPAPGAAARPETSPPEAEAPPPRRSSGASGGRPRALR